MEHMEQTRHLEDVEREIDLTRAAEETWRLLEETGAEHSASTLIKQPGMRVVLMTLKGDATVKSHQVSADISVQVLRGRIRFRVEEHERVLERGHLLAVARDLPHDLVATEDSEVLLTLSWRS
jgi:quercetin dioxygenase-like cupin family protein